MIDKISCVILAAGQGTRMNYPAPKPLVPLRSLCLVDYSLNAVYDFEESSKINIDVSIVTGFGKDKVESYINEKFKSQNINYAFQAEQKGTGHAVQTYVDQVNDSSSSNYTLVMCADTPLITSFEIKILVDYVLEKNLDVCAASFEASNPFGYGRILRGSKGVSIIEEKDASSEQREIKEVNSGLYLVKTSYLLENIKKLDNTNASGEFYLTDLLKDVNGSGACFFPSGESFLGVNDLYQLSYANKVLNDRKIKMLSQKGIFFEDLNSVYIDEKVQIEKGCHIFPNTFFYGECSIGENVEVMPGCVLRDSKVGKNVKLLPYSILEQAVIETGASVGPFSRLRPDASIGENCKIGNFVEVKKSTIEKGAKVSHLSYVGDSRIGENTNIGCGFISVNYDGANKHFTNIGKNSFIGSGSQAIAPIEIGDNSFVAAGSTLNQDVPEDAFAIARAKQVTKENLAKKFLKKKK